MLCGEERAVDLVACDFLAAGVRQFGLLVYQNQLGYTHKVGQDGDLVCNEIIQHYAILPNPTQKIHMFAFVDMENWTVKFADKKRVLDGEELFLLPDRLLNCTMPVSPKDTVKKGTHHCQSGSRRIWTKCSPGGIKSKGLSAGA